MKRLPLFAIFATVITFNAKAYDFSAVSPSGQTLYYNINGTSATVTRPGSTGWNGYDKPTGTLTILDSVEYDGNKYGVNSIGTSAFMSCSGLTSVILPEGLTEIGSYAFYNCRGLASITIPDTGSEAR